MEQAIDRLVRQQPNRAVVIAASNSHDDGIHAQGTVPAAAPYELAWAVAPGDGSENELEIWYPGAARLDVEIVAPNGQKIGTLSPGNSGTVTRNGTQVLFAASRLADPNNGDNTIGIFLSRRLAPGTWKLRLTNTTGAEVAFHAWIERDDSGQSTFLPPARDDHYTLGSISCGHEAIVVGSYDAHNVRRLDRFPSSPALAQLVTGATSLSFRPPATQ